MDIRLYLLTCGEVDLDQSTLTPGRGAGSRVRIPVPAYLVQAGGQTILFDTGMPALCYAGDPRALADESEPDPPWAIPYGGADDTVIGQLTAMQLRPADVELVVNSHLHFDHCGGDAHFTHCPLLLQADALAAARAMPDQYDPAWGWDAPGLRHQTIVGDFTLAPGVELLATPGHAPGHQSLLLRLPNTGPMLLTFDAVYTEPLWLADELGAAADPELARASMDRLRGVARETGAQVIFGHDPSQWSRLRHPPLFYD